MFSRSSWGILYITYEPLFTKATNADVTKCTINGKTAVLAKYDDPYANFKIHSSATVQQHHMLRKKLDGVLHDPPEFELVISIPNKVRIEPAVCLLRASV
jgi:hypothetical protein